MKIKDLVPLFMLSCFFVNCSESKKITPFRLHITPAPELIDPSLSPVGLLSELPTQTGAAATSPSQPTSPAFSETPSTEDDLIDLIPTTVSNVNRSEPVAVPIPMLVLAPACDKTPLLCYVYNNETEKVLAWIQAGKSLNQVDELSRNLFHYAALLGHNGLLQDVYFFKTPEVLELIVKADAHGYQPLHYALLNKQLSTALWFFDRDIHENDLKKESLSFYEWIVLCDGVPLLKNLKKTTLLTFVHEKRGSLLHYAASLGRQQIVEELLLLADLWGVKNYSAIRNSERNTALYESLIQNWNDASIQTLIEKKAALYAGEPNTYVTKASELSRFDLTANSFRAVLRGLGKFSAEGVNESVSDFHIRKNDFLKIFREAGFKNESKVAYALASAVNINQPWDGDRVRLLLDLGGRFKAGSIPSAVQIETMLNGKGLMDVVAQHISLNEPVTVENICETALSLTYGKPVIFFARYLKLGADINSKACSKTLLERKLEEMKSNDATSHSFLNQLLNAGANVNIPNADGRLPLIHLKSCNPENDEIFTRILSLTNYSYVNTQQNNAPVSFDLTYNLFANCNETLLKKYLTLVQSKGFNINAEDSLGNTVAMTISLHEALIKPLKAYSGIDFQHVNHQGQNFLFTHFSDLETALKLADGIDIHGTDSSDHGLLENALRLASTIWTAKNDDRSLHSNINRAVDTLRKAGVKLRAAANYPGDVHPLQLAAERGIPALAMLSLKSGAGAREVFDIGKNAIQIAREKKHALTAALLETYPNVYDYLYDEEIVESLQDEKYYRNWERSVAVLPLPNGRSASLLFTQVEYRQPTHTNLQYVALFVIRNERYETECALRFEPRSLASAIIYRKNNLLVFHFGERYLSVNDECVVMDHEFGRYHSTSYFYNNGFLVRAELENHSDNYYNLIFDDLKNYSVPQSALFPRAYVADVKRDHLRIVTTRKNKYNDKLYRTLSYVPESQVFAEAMFDSDWMSRGKWTSEGFEYLSRFNRQYSKVTLSQDKAVETPVQLPLLGYPDLVIETDAGYLALVSPCAQARSGAIENRYYEVMSFSETAEGLRLNWKKRFTNTEAGLNSCPRVTLTYDTTLTNDMKSLWITGSWKKIWDTLDGESAELARLNLNDGSVLYTYSDGLKTQ